MLRSLEQPSNQKPHIPPESFSFRASCYEAFGWTPWDVKRLLAEYPLEAKLLAARFEAQAEYHQHQRKDAERRNRENARHGGASGASDGGFETDDVIGGDDEETVDPLANDDDDDETMEGTRGDLTWA